MIVITGATGQLGQEVVKALLTKYPAHPFVVTARTAQKAEMFFNQGITVRIADYDHAEDWASALEGAEKVLLISSNDIGKRVAQHQTVIDAAKLAKVNCLAYTSLLHAETSSLALAQEHKATEHAIKTSGIPYVILRNGWYTENYTSQINATLAQQAIYGCAGDGLISTASRQDYAEAAAIVLTSEDHIGHTYELAGDHAFSMQDYAQSLSESIGFSIPYHNLSQQAFQEALIKAGLPEAFAALLADADKGIADGQLFESNRRLSELIGRPTTPLEISIQHALIPSQAG